MLDASPFTGRGLAGLLYSVFVLSLLLNDLGFCSLGSGFGFTEELDTHVESGNNLSL
jgi:hypothetical protein